MALADTYSFSYTMNGISLIGDLTTDSSNNILSVTNAFYDDPTSGVSGAVTLDTNPTDLSTTTADNVFYPAGSPYLDHGGMLLSMEEYVKGMPYLDYIQIGYSGPFVILTCCS